MAVTLTGIKPSNTPHLGNYVGAIRPAIELAQSDDSYLFIADYHALTTTRDPEALREFSFDVAATWLACGLDPEKAVLWRQSDVPEVFELAWVLSCVIATGQLERGHSYKDALAKNQSPNAGIFYYPMLMAADILLYDADQVPVGKDQKQHVELTRDAATRINHIYGEGTLVVPAPRISDGPLVPGTDGHKMSKSKGNSIPLFAPPKKLRKVIMGIKTGSETLEEKKKAEGSTVYELCKLVDPGAAAEMKTKLEAGNYGWGHAKELLFETLETELGPKRDRYDALRADRDALSQILETGAARARQKAHKTIERVRAAIGIR